MKVKLLFAIFVLTIGNSVFLIRSYSFPGPETEDPSNYSDTTKLPVISHINDSIINSKNIDPFYGLQFYKNGILFMTNTKNKYNALSDYISFGRFDTYYVPMKALHLGTPEYFTNDAPFSYPPGALCFTKDYKTMFLTKPIKDTSANLCYAIYQMEWDPVKDGWSNNMKLLSFCNTDYSYMDPAISFDGKTLVFSSDMPAKQGGTNLFKSTKSKLGWSVPKSLGNIVNSNGDELFPFLDRNNNLYFSSNRKNGSGYDIFFSRFNMNGWDKPVALGREINSVSNEMIFKVIHDNSLALLVSFNDSGMAQLHFYTLGLSDHMKSPPKTTSVKNIPKRKTILVTQHKATTVTPVKKKKMITSGPPPIQLKPQKNIGKIVFRLQILSSMKPKGSFMVTVNHKKYKTWQYFYKGAYRYTIGEFDHVVDAIQFNSLCVKNGFSQAFVAAFRNNKRVTDPKVFKH